MSKGCQLRLLRSIYTQRFTKGFGVVFDIGGVGGPSIDGRRDDDDGGGDVISIVGDGLGD